MTAEIELKTFEYTIDHKSKRQEAEEFQKWIDSHIAELSKPLVCSADGSAVAS
jgi:hypothetical protein